MAGYIGSKAVSVNTTSATISDDLAVGDDLTVTDDATVGGTLGVTGVLTTTAATVFNGGFAANDASTIIAADGASDNDWALQVKNQEATDDRSFGVLIQAGSTATDAPLRIATHDNGTTLFNLSGTGQAQFLDGTDALPAISNLGDLNTGMYFPAADTLGFSTAGAEKLRLHSSGNLSLGSTSGSYKLYVKGTDSSDSGDITTRLEAGTVSSNSAVNDVTLDLTARSKTSGGTGIAHNTEIRSLGDASGNGGTLAFYTDNSSAAITQRMVIKSSGNVGIGTSAPARELSVKGASTTGNIQICNNSSGVTDADGVLLQLNSTTTYLWNYESGSLVIATNNSEACRINSAGDVLLGCTAQGNTHAYFDAASNSRMVLHLGSSSTSGTTVAVYRNPNGAVGTISTSGSATAYNTSSDYRLKENVDYTWDATSRLKQLKPARFNFIADANTTVDGFLAHEAQAVVPECVTGTKDAMVDEEYEVSAAIEEVTDEDGNVTTEAVDAVMGTRSVPDMQGIDQSKLVPLLVKTIQELEARITALEG